VDVPGVLVKIRSLYTSLPKAERNVADYILANAEDAPRSSVQQFARAGGVSVASVSRFVRKMGFPDFKDFKLELARETGATARYLFEQITPRDSDEEIARKVFLGNIRSLEDTLKILSLPDMMASARAITSCRRLIFFGIGGSGNVARDEALRFSYLDVQAEGYVDPSQILLQALRVSPTDVVVGISHSGRSSITVEGMRIAQDKGGITVGVSNYLRSPLRDACRYFFCTSFPETKVKVAALSSRAAQLCVLDALYLLTARHTRSLWDVEKVNALTERMLRLKGRR
jgi:RpiR family transcriptional regulator, carbohydrate utilization regulator